MKRVTEKTKAPVPAKEPELQKASTSIKATSRIRNGMLAYSVEGNTKPVSIIIKNIDSMNLPPLVNQKACIHCQSVQYLDSMLRDSIDKAPADFVDKVGETETEDELEVNIL